ncbi:MAG: type II toxin-antitoxin system Phd/YefM family antitoxin [Alphaproteobacteria bacterium]|nr:type II toxin-antitoxin system Phd/YefM family antitoxin [Alphaproteobacteria bacterium]
MDGVWPVAEAKAKFSELIKRARRDGPQTITRKGKRTVVVVSADEWSRKSPRVGNLAEFFAASPLHGVKLKIRRSKSRTRPVSL